MSKHLIETELIQSEMEDLGNQTSREINTLILNRFLENDVLNNYLNPINVVILNRNHVWILLLLPVIALYSVLSSNYIYLLIILFILAAFIIVHLLKIKEFNEKEKSKYFYLRQLFPSNHSICCMLITLGYNNYTRGVFSLSGVRSNVLNSESNDKELERIFIQMIKIVYPRWQKEKEIIKNESSLLIS